MNSNTSDGSVQEETISALTQCKGNHLSAVSAYGETIHRSCRDRNGRKEGVVKRKKRRKK
jgi:hypothetical protein